MESPPLLAHEDPDIEAQNHPLPTSRPPSLRAITPRPLSPSNSNDAHIYSHTYTAYDTRSRSEPGLLSNISIGRLRTLLILFCAAILMITFYALYIDTRDQRRTVVEEIGVLLPSPPVPTFASEISSAGDTGGKKIKLPGNGVHEANEGTTVPEPGDSKDSSGKKSLVRRSTWTAGYEGKDAVLVGSPESEEDEDEEEDEVDEDGESGKVKQPSGSETLTAMDVMMNDILL